MVFERSEIASLDARVIASLNALTILYNSYAVAFSVLAWFVIRLCLSKGQKWAFWLLLITIGFVEILAFIASAPLGNARWQVNIPLSALYIVGIGLSGYSLFKGDKK
jgi:Sec-independent protein secretion pathway component TatC